MSPRKYKLRVEDILKAVRKILAYTDGLTADTFFADLRTLEAVLWNFAVIGEATRHIPLEIEARYPEVPWTQMRTMRNFIIHDYPRIDPKIIWQTIEDDLPPLASLLESVLAAPDEEEG